MIASPKKPFGKKAEKPAEDPMHAAMDSVMQDHALLGEKAKGTPAPDSDEPPAGFGQPPIVVVVVDLWEECPVMGAWRRFLAWLVEWPKP
jgi:hypothetical protein